MRIAFNFPAHVVTDLNVIKQDIEKKNPKREPSFYEIIISLIKEMRERIEFEKLNPKRLTQ